MREVVIELSDETEAALLAEGRDPEAYVHEQVQHALRPTVEAFRAQARRPIEAVLSTIIPAYLQADGAAQAAVQAKLAEVRAILDLAE